MTDTAVHYFCNQTDSGEPHQSEMFTWYHRLSNRKSSVPVSDKQPDTQHLASRACHRHLLPLLVFPRILFAPQLRPPLPFLARLFYFLLCRKVAWRVAGARALWTWSDLGRNLRSTPGWLHASTARWRTVATYVALAGAAFRVSVRRILL